VRGYCRYPLSYRNLEEMMAERGVEVDHSTINRWVLKFAPELDKRLRSHLSLTNDSWRVDETYIQVKGEWKYLYRAVDSAGNTLDFMLSAKRRSRSFWTKNNAKEFVGKISEVISGSATDVKRDRLNEASSFEGANVPA